MYSMQTNKYHLNGRMAAVDFSAQEEFGADFGWSNPIRMHMIIMNDILKLVHEKLNQYQSVPNLDLGHTVAPHQFTS